MLQASQMTPVLPERRIAELASLVRTSTRETRRTVSPLTGAEVATVPVSSVNDVADACAAARRAQQERARTALASRQQMLLRLHDLVLDHQGELLDLIQIESGKSRAHAFDEVAHLALTARYYGRRLAKILGPHRRSGVYPGPTRVRQLHQPKGVVGILTPWNYPPTTAISDGLAAVAAGNAVVHKRDGQSPLTALAGVELLRRAGFPTQLRQVVSGQMGGMRESGIGRRQGAEGLLRFTESQAIGAQSLLPVSGPAFVGAGRFARLLTHGLRLLKAMGPA
ncbi:aldehyde dehydrogenase family protein [uncultured Aeromicrobium sp.]|uniref:aldehyde dehydrogenase family protein n=1 Tax=uncultured Aeromicrobium sp. TaxID=337820 RepID=UPI0025D003C9|nr:aldehyde dehydrogenase family protein [uncultured Aeromicrobium sp.]